MWKIAKKCENYETILPFSCCPLVFPEKLENAEVFDRTRCSRTFECGTKGVFLEQPSSWYHSGPEKGVITKGVSSLEKSLVSLTSLNSLEFSRISRQWSDSSSFSTVWGFSRISTFSRISRQWTFLNRPLFPTRTNLRPPDFSSKARKP